MNGTLLGNRYELIEKIGGGGMAIVYKARCRLLNRIVAVKILRPEFSNDEEFVKRFLVEAQAAASLSHPNIVPIYDVGNEEDIRYIVMEYIDGITLKDYINQEGTLDWKEAVDISVQICSAIEHAHRKLIVHRDIKPQNILLTKEGIAKVADFGIARAVSSSTITMVGSTIGSVHYFSPEQARGGFTDEKSDLYSLGIVLYEMVTGKLPFDGETPVAIALKHIQSTAVEPVEIDKSLPHSVNNIIMKAIRKDQGDRYQSASEMLSDLCRAVDEPDGDYVFDEEDEDEYPTRKIQSIGGGNLGQSRAYKNVSKDKGKNGKKKDKTALVLAILTSLIIISVSIYLGYSIVMPQMAPANKFVMGNYVGKDYDQVKQELENAKLGIKEKWSYSETVPKNVVIFQNTAPGQEIKLGGFNEIELEISRGRELVKMPDLKKLDYRTAEIQIRELKLEPKVEEEFNDTVPTGVVIRTDPDVDSEVKPGTIITIYKSKGPELKQTQVPNLIGKTMDEARQLLTGSNLAIGKLEPADVSNVVAKVIQQNPAAGTPVDEGAAVDLTFDTGSTDSSNTGSTTGGGDTGNNTSVKMNEVKVIYSLTDPKAFGDKVKVWIEVSPSTTNTAEVLMDKTVKKSDFPLVVSVPVPEGGKTWVKVMFDNKVYYEYYQEEV